MTVVDLALAVPPESEYRIEQLSAILDDDERDRASRFRHDADRQLHITAHALKRLALSRWRPEVAPAEWRFSDGPWGRPHPVNAETGDLQVNLSHTKGMTAVAVADGVDVGVDVEWTGPDDWIYETTDTVFSAAEVASLFPLDEAERRDRFFLYWTLKESYIKARGMGVSLPLTLISFAASEGDDAVLDLDPSLDDNPTAWTFEIFRPAPDVRGAVAVRSPSLELEVSWPAVII